MMGQRTSSVAGCQSLSRRDEGRIFECLLESLDQALLVVDSTRHEVLEVNGRACSLLGRGRAELEGRSLHGVLPEASPLLRELRDSAGAASRRLIRPVGGSVELIGFPVPLGRGETYVLLGREIAPDTAPPDLSDDEGLIETNLQFPSIIGSSDRIRQVCRLIGLVAKTDTTVLVRGESGTGKELVAQSIHFHSRRSSRPLVKVNCSALSDTLLESELFGHKKGAFTGAIQNRKGRFELADRGTIILDEIGSMSLAGQAKLLRVLQEREFEPVGASETVRVDVRVVAVTNATLEDDIERGRFREDLFYRLNAFPIALPPLRERKEDVPLLARHFLRCCAHTVRRKIPSIDRDAMAALTRYDWPGNVRELANAIEYAAILERSEELSWRSLPEKLRGSSRPRPTLRERLNRAEKKMIMEALNSAEGVQNRAAKLLGMDRRNLAYFLNKHSIRPYRGAACAAAGTD